MKLESTDNHPLVLTFSNTGPANYNAMWLRVKAESSEMIFGLGEQYSFLNLRGRKYPVWVREQGYIFSSFLLISSASSQENLPSGFPTKRVSN